MEIKNEDYDEQMWKQKLQEIRDFQTNHSGMKISDLQVDQMTKIYEKYRHVFSNKPGKARNFCCKLKFKEPVNFNRKSYPIAHYEKRCKRRNKKKC